LSTILEHEEDDERREDPQDSTEVGERCPKLVVGRGERCRRLRGRWLRSLVSHVRSLTVSTGPSWSQERLCALSRPPKGVTGEHMPKVVPSHTARNDRHTMPERACSRYN